jgi:hypothetical protein
MKTVKSLPTKARKIIVDFKKIDEVHGSNGPGGRINAYYDPKAGSFGFPHLAIAKRR